MSGDQEQNNLIVVVAMQTGRFGRSEPLFAFAGADITAMQRQPAA
jgi:hypothetical protein